MIQQNALFKTKKCTINRDRQSTESSETETETTLLGPRLRPRPNLPTGTETKNFVIRNKQIFCLFIFKKHEKLIIFQLFAWTRVILSYV